MSLVNLEEKKTANNKESSKLIFKQSNKRDGKYIHFLSSKGKSRLVRFSQSEKEKKNLSDRWSNFKGGRHF